MLAGFFSILLVRHFLAAEINLPHAIIRLHFLDRAFANDGALVQDRHDACDLPYEINVVLDDDDRVFIRK